MEGFKGTPHNTAAYGDIARTVLMPGDPLRAELIADHFLEDAVQFNRVRNMFGYTGTYKGVRLSVMGHGMGIPSMGIYSYELFRFYDVQNIIRIGSCGGYLDQMKLFDIILVDAAYSASTYAKTAFGYEEDLMYPDRHITDLLEEKAGQSGATVYRGIANSTDCFYYDPAFKKPDPYPTIAGEMESFALFANARYFDRKAACILTISDKKDEVATVEERQNHFFQMIGAALDAAVELESE